MPHYRYFQVNFTAASIVDYYADVQSCFKLFSQSSNSLDFVILLGRIKLHSEKGNCCTTGGAKSQVRLFGWLDYRKEWGYLGVLYYPSSVFRWWFFI